LVLEELKASRVTFCVGLADTALVALTTLLDHDQAIRYIPVTREGEAFALASGVWMGGQNPVILVQNTGLLESGDALRGTAQRMRVPLLCLITYRGYSDVQGQKRRRLSPLQSADELSKADLDSAALFTEPTLKAWGVPFGFLGSDADLPKIRHSFNRAQKESRPVALLVTNTMS